MIHIAVTATFEAVLSSICYMPYWHFVAARIAGRDVRIVEDCTVTKFDEEIGAVARPGDVVLIDLSQAAQRNVALTLWRKYRTYLDIRFVGYEPFVRTEGLPFLDPAELGLDIGRAALEYPYHNHLFKYGYSTIDSHVVCPGDDRPFVPVFMSVGCKRDCAYCYVTHKRANYPFGSLGLEEAKRVIDYADERGWNLHFEDENFFYWPHSKALVEYMVGKDMKWIVLADSISLSNRMKRWGPQLFVDAGMWLAEIGLETASPEVLSKHQDMSLLLRLQEETPFNIFWLAVTLLPGETLATLAETGRFHKRYGMPWDRLVARLKSQSCHGGLGQFFQPYPGTPGWQQAESGIWLTETPHRLSPSWIGNDFANDIPIAVSAPATEEDWQWPRLYSKTDAEVMDVLEQCDGTRSVVEVTGYDPDRLSALCCLTKLGHIAPALTPPKVPTRLELVK
jgi:hypothetical protein